MMQSSNTLHNPSSDQCTAIVQNPDISRMANSSPLTSIYDRISSALSTLGKRGRSDGGGQANPKDGKQHHALRIPSPYDQAALHERLLTFRPLTWWALVRSLHGNTYRS